MSLLPSFTIRRSEWLIAFVAAIGLTLVFWGPLWTGGGIIGGDTYSYFLPQKQFLAERLHAGELPRWNNRSGLGYPLVAESQTGVFYPPNLILYRLLELQTAYNASHLLHYVAAFLLMWRLSRELGLAPIGALLAALVYVYGWFPPRLCWEWAIVGGCYLPGVLLFAERFLKSRCQLPPGSNLKSQLSSLSSNLAIVTGLLAMQMLAGHFHLAFITQLTLVGYVALRLTFVPSELASNGGIGCPPLGLPQGLGGLCASPSVTAASSSAEAVEPLRQAQGRTFVGRIVSHRLRTFGFSVGAIVLALVVAAPQLLPTWELKRISQRQTTTSRDFDPGYGHIPPMYLTQVVASWWFWYSDDIDRDQALGQLRLGAISSGTNQVEAHLYFGLLPLGLILLGFAHAGLRERFANRATFLWLLLALGAVLYTTGWLLPVTRYLPGFSFFRGLGRFGIVATLAVGVLSGCALELVCARLTKTQRRLAGVLMLGLTGLDLFVVGRIVNYAVLVSPPPLAALERSDVRQLLHQSDQPVRLYAPGPNLTNLLGVSSVPEYLGLGPAEYYDERTKARSLERLTPEFLDWAEGCGITHILSFSALPSSASEPRLRERFRGIDPFLHFAWGRSATEPLYLYELTQSRGRVVLSDPETGSVRITEYAANRVVLDVNAERGTTVILRDLFYPGWTVTIDGRSAPAQRIEELFRGVEVEAGRHVVEWRF